MQIKNKKKFIIIVIMAIIIAVVLMKTTSNLKKAVSGKKASAKTPVTAVEEEAPQVKIFKIKRMDFKDTLPVIGNIKGFREVDLRFQSPGIVESFNFEEGEKIQEGDIIASLDQRDALLKLKYADIELNKNKKLFEIGAISQVKLDQAKLEYESAKSDLDKTNIYALVDGYLGSRNIDVGGYVNPSSTNDTIGKFIETNKVYAEFSVIEKDMPNIALGQKADVFIDAYPSKSYNGTVDRIAPIIEGRSRTMNIKVELDNKDGLLKPGLFVRALIYTYDKKDVIVIPFSSIKKKEADIFVYVVVKEEPKVAPEEKDDKKKAAKKGFNIFGKKKDKDKQALPDDMVKEKEPQFGTIEIRKVKIGHTTADLVEIEEGLNEDEFIVVEVQEEFKDKSRVEIAEMQEGLI